MTLASVAMPAARMRRLHDADTASPLTVWLVHGDVARCEEQRAVLERWQFCVVALHSIGDAVQRVPVADAGIAIINDELPDGAGLDFLRDLRGRGFAGTVIVTSATRSVRSSVEAIRCGANNFLVEPYSGAQLAMCICDSLVSVRIDNTRPDKSYLR